MFGPCVTEGNPSRSPTQIRSSLRLEHQHGMRVCWESFTEHTTDFNQPSNLPNLRRLFVEARTDAEESEYSRNAVRLSIHIFPSIILTHIRTVLQPRHLHVIYSWLQLDRAAHDDR